MVQIKINKIFLFCFLANTILLPCYGIASDASSGETIGHKKVFFPLEVPVLVLMDHVWFGLETLGVERKDVPLAWVENQEYAILKLRLIRDLAELNLAQEEMKTLLIPAKKFISEHEFQQKMTAISLKFPQGKFLAPVVVEQSLFGKSLANLKVPIQFYPKVKKGGKIFLVLNQLVLGEICRQTGIVIKEEEISGHILGHGRTLPEFEQKMNEILGMLFLIFEDGDYVSSGSSSLID